MGEKDIAEKTLEAYNDVFADIVNVLLFDGKRLVQENELETNGTISQIKIDGKIHEQERDVSKIWKNGEIRISILGFENQTIPDADMPLRVMSYDGASYKQQLLDDTTKQRYPVITLVLYFGEKHWNKPKTLLECIKLPDELKTFLDYRYYEKFLDERFNRTPETTDRESAIIFGLPKELIEGVLVGRQIEQDEEKLKYIKSKLKDSYICNLDGKVIVGNK